MSHLVFARKYRPQTFKEIVGQEHVTKALTNAIVRNKVPHALLFTGPRGVGKTTSARVLSKALNCTGRKLPETNEGLSQAELINQVEPCGTCSNCKEIAKGSNLAVVEIDGASNNSVDNVRALIETLITAPPPNIKYKIYIIDEVHMLSVAAFNALLKTLEEPPPHTIFIFATTEPHKIPDTVISRCQQHDFRRFSIKNVREQLRFIVDSENLKVEEEVLSLIAKKCFGGMRDASSLLERVVSFSDENVTLDEASRILGVFDFGYFSELIEAICKNNKEDALELVSKAFSTSVDVKSYFSDFVSSFRLASLYALSMEGGKDRVKRFVASEELSDTDVEYLDKIVSLNTSEIFFQMYDLAREVSDIALKSQFPKFALEAGVIKLSDLSKLISISSLLERFNPSMLGKSFEAQGETTLKKNSKSEPENVIPKPVETLDSDEASDPLLNFNWSEFLIHLKKAGQLRLETYLRRVAPKRIDVDVKNDKGTLELLAPEFVSNALNDNEVLTSLKKVLVNYSRISNWVVDVTIHKSEVETEKTSESFKSTGTAPKIAKLQHVPGSQESKSLQNKVNQAKKIEHDAREDELVKQALSVFAGSVIEKITPIQKPVKQ